MLTVNVAEALGESAEFWGEDGCVYLALQKKVDLAQVVKRCQKQISVTSCAVSFPSFFIWWKERVKDHSKLVSEASLWTIFPSSLLRKIILVAILSGRNVLCAINLDFVKTH